VPRKTIELTEKADKIYENIPWKDKGRFVSDAIIEKAEKKQPFTTEQIEFLDKRYEKRKFPG